MGRALRKNDHRGQPRQHEETHCSRAVSASLRKGAVHNSASVQESPSTVTVCVHCSLWARSVSARTPPAKAEITCREGMDTQLQSNDPAPSLPAGTNSDVIPTRRTGKRCIIVNKVEKGLWSVAQNSHCKKSAATTRWTGISPMVQKSRKGWGVAMTMLYAAQAVLTSRWRR